MKIDLTSVLSFNGGYVDTAGFLAFQGLFTAHVTGNFVTLGAALALGTSGALTKLLALPTFCAVVIITRLLSYVLSAAGLPILRFMLILKFVLLATGTALVISLGPFPNADGLSALLTGLTFVSAMAIQNAVHRIHLGSAPPTTLMTGATTQMMIDIADLLLGRLGKRDVARERLLKLATSVGSFALGCAAAALLFIELGKWCFVVPPLVAAATLLMRLAAFEGDMSPAIDKTGPSSQPARNP